jgi:peptidoglycan/LPS O-acetylase OafA/YrhL
MLQHRFDALNNSLNFMRLVLVAVVIVSHSWPLGGFGPDPQVGDRELGRWAVAGFFAISGYLITGSRDRITLPDFLWRRVLRIYPGFSSCRSWGLAFVFAPLSVLIGTGSYALEDVVSFLARNAGLRIHQWEIGSTLAVIPIATRGMARSGRCTSSFSVT